MSLKSLNTKKKNEKAAFTAVAEKVEVEITNEEFNLINCQILLNQLDDKFNRLCLTEDKILDLLNENDFEIEFNAAEADRDLYLSLKVKLNYKMEEHQSKVVDQVLSLPSNVVSAEKNRKFKLPELELRKFSGDAREFLGFWSQFSKIHEDPNLAAEDKFQYLAQCVTPNSRAAQLISSFPLTATNYPKAVQQLKDRFGRDDLLVQIYVRDLLNLVMKNATTGRTATDLAVLYDSIESKLRALESLGRTKEKFADFLGPLVESCLPESILRAWERSRVPEDGVTRNSERTLDNLMIFLRHEVESEEMIKLAQTGFTGNVVKRVCNKNVSSDNLDMSTAAMLVSTNEFSNGKLSFTCIFCDKPHSSAKCFKAEKMSFNDKKLIVQKKKACFACLRIGHLRNQCKANIKCFICNGNHLKLMCSKNMKENECKQKDSKSEVSLSNNSNDNVYLQSLCINIFVKGKRKKIRALIDSGSQHSYVAERVIREMRVDPIREERIIHCLFGGKETEPLSHSVFSLQVGDLDRTFKLCLEAFSEEKICGFVPIVNDPKILQELKQRKIKITDSICKENEIDLLLGADVIGKLLTREFVQLSSGLTAVKTRLGWALMGKQINNEYVTDNVLSSLSLHARDISVKYLWELEALGISDPTENIKTKNRMAEEKIDFENKLSILPDGRYELELPWKHETNQLPDNKIISLMRHEKMIKRAKESGFLGSYQKVFQEWEELNIIERVPEKELDNKCHYLPHRPVIKMDSETTKVRPVFDASANEKGKPSLNQCLFKGPNLVEFIPDIVDRFRMFPIGLSADIEKAFLQLSIVPKDRDYLRFFYPCDEEIQIYRHCRVVFGVSCSPYLLNASIIHLLNNSSPDFKKVTHKLKNSFYVDNCITGVNNVKEEENFIEQAKIIMSKGCFNLRSWESNVACKFTSKHSGDTSLLGMLWNLDNDTLRCKINANMLTCDVKVTKRLILSIVQSIFDPVGILAPTTLLPKLILQQTWKQSIHWDDMLPEDIVNKFCLWLNDVHLLKDVTIPRYVGSNATFDLHVFVDACKNAYAACVFARTRNSSGIMLTLLRAKSRVAPLKILSIPRLELMSCCIGARLAFSICNAINAFDMKITFWSDSTVALWWIKNHGEWSNFVANRVKEIRHLTQSESWRHVPGHMNPADILSRGCSPSRMLDSEWFNGPLWLKQNPESWPVNEIFGEPNEVNDEHKKVKLININVSEFSDPFDVGRFSNYDKLIRVFGWVLRFINNCRSTPNLCKNLSVHEIVSSEKCLIRFIQNSYLTDLKTVNCLDVFTDNENIIRVKTRITERKDSSDFLRPIWLPGKCIFTELLIESVHRKNCHAGLHMMQSLLRERFWITKQRKTVRKVLNRCVKCKRYKSKPMSCDSVPLPADRVENCSVFTVVGTDLAGPLFLKDGGKVWIALFTCAVYRAVHMELVSSLSAESFLLALRRFIARRGRPEIIYSDNGGNFRGAFNELSKLDWKVILKETNTKRIFWKFNPPTASWWGGWWERLVRVIKELLRRTLGKSVLSYEELETIICDCESVVNSRPLTYVSEDSQDLIPLTPSMFLKEDCCSDVTDIDEVDSQHLQKRIRYRAKLLRDLRSRFRKEYLGQLVMKQTQGKVSREPEIGEVVLIGDDFKKRLYWPLARVIEKIQGRDGKVRTVRLKTSSGIFIRPIQRIYPLEITTKEINSPGGMLRSNDPVNETECDEQSSCPEKILEKKFTSSGRLIKIPKRLDLFNQGIYVFESFATDSKRGEDVA